MSYYVFLAVVACGILAQLNMWPGANYWRIAGLCGLIYLCIATVRAARSENLPRRITTLGLIYLTSILFFATLYDNLFLYNSQSFAFSTPIREGRIMEEISKPAMDIIWDIEVKLAHTAILQKRAEKALLAVQHPITASWDEREKILSSAQGFTPINGGYALRLIRLMRRGINEEEFEILFFAEIAHHGQVVRMGENHRERERIADIAGAKDKHDLENNLRRLADTIENELKRISAELHDTIVSSGVIRFPLFAYFSVATITTKGYGDIVPNTRTARHIAATEAAWGIFYIAFALYILWPAPPTGVHPSAPADHQEM